MSQIYKPSAGGGGSSIQTIDGDVGSVTGATIELYANHGSANCGSTILFNAASATELDLVVNDNNFSILLGENAGNSTITGTNNVGIGVASLSSLTTGSQNAVCGFATGTAITTGQNNSILGWAAGNQLTTGFYNIILGFTAGQSYTSSESSNILINNLGVVGESNTTRIGTQGSSAAQQNACFVAGIVGNTVSNAELVTVNSSTGQLGVANLGSRYSASYYLNTSVTNVTGDSTQYQIVLDTAIFDPSSAYNTGTGVFTAPVTGNYMVTYTFTMTNVLVANNNLLALVLNQTNSKQYVGNVNNPYPITESGVVGFSASCIVPATAGDTITLQLIVGGGTKTIGLFGAGGGPGLFTTATFYLLT